MDGSLLADAKTPSSYEYNVEITRHVVEMAHAVGVSVEGELGVLGSLETLAGDKEDGHGAEGAMTREQLLTDPAQAADFVNRTHVDALAIAIGTSHGAYKFTRKPDGEILAISRIKEIHARIPNTHLVMHGSSSVPQEWLAVIREFGGEMPETWGVPVEQIQEGIRNGVRKVNIDTDIRLAMTGAMRRALAQKRSEFDPRKILKEAQLAAKACAGSGTRRSGAPGWRRASGRCRWRTWPPATPSAPSPRSSVNGVLDRTKGLERALSWGLRPLWRGWRRCHPPSGRRSAVPLDPFERPARLGQKIMIKSNPRGVS